MAEEELMVVLRKSEDATFGFSLLRTEVFPHVIYDIVENSPAAECGEVEAGDVIVKVNGTDVHGFTTKDVLKCLRLSTDPVTLELKRDPKIKAHVRKYLQSISNQHPHADHNCLDSSSQHRGFQSPVLLNYACWSHPGYTTGIQTTDRSSQSQIFATSSWDFRNQILFKMSMYPLHTRTPFSITLWYSIIN